MVRVPNTYNEILSNYCKFSITPVMGPRPVDPDAVIY